MNTTKLMKREYVSPKLNITKLDNSISLELQSVPPVGPGEPGYVGKNNIAPEYFNNNPLNA